jgi:cellulose synthase/poly-beta-1,6-N-acetylglucosamine synthase-like glycosyltransferase
MLQYHSLHILIVFFMISAVITPTMLKRRAGKYKGAYTGESKPVTVIVPVHLEDATQFEKCLSSIEKQKADQLIVSIDSQDATLKEIAESHGAEVISYAQRVGKRQALADAWLKARNDIIVHVDSDIVLDENCLSEITKPFSDTTIAGVSGSQVPTENKSKLAYVLSSLINKNVNMNSKALNGGLVVVHGRCSAWRKEFLLSVREKFLNDNWMGARSEIGDDRFLSREVLKQGLKTVYQESAKMFVISPSTFKEFTGQQIRYRRSGTKFWLKDLKEGVRPSKAYSLHTSIYYLSPFIFLAAVILDTLYFRLPFKPWTEWWVALPVLLVGCTTVTLVRQLIYFGKPLYLRYLIVQGLLGLFVLLPVSIYGALTVSNQQHWITRSYNTTLMNDGGDSDGKKKTVKKILSTAILAALGIAVFVEVAYSVALMPEGLY